MGEKVADVTAHPVLGPTVDLVGGAYDLCDWKDPEVRNLYVAAPDKKDWDHPDLHDYLEHYLGGSDKYSTLDRMKMIHETMCQTCSHESAFHEVLTVHPEGSLEAQKMMILAEAPLNRYEEMAKRKAGIIPWNAIE